MTWLKFISDALTAIMSGIAAFFGYRAGKRDAKIDKIEADNEVRKQSDKLADELRDLDSDALNKRLRDS